MRYRQLGCSGLSVSEIGYGAWGIGESKWVGATEDESVRALHRAVDLGVNFIDTARGYGESERIVGRVVRERGGEEVRVATKVPPKNRVWQPSCGTDPAEAFPGVHIRESLETSLRTSGLDHFDVLQFHIWSDDWVGRGDWLETISELKREGKIRLFGVSVNDHQPDSALALVRSGAVDSVQVIYNIFDQAPADSLLPACEEHGVGVIVRVALDEGGLTGRVTADTVFPEGDWRNRYFRDDRPAQVGRRVAAIVADLGIAPDEIAATALRFVLSSTAVSTVIPGMRSVRNVERNTAVSDGRPLTGEQLAVLAKHRWQRNFYA
ncbi:MULTISPECIES: aldo/keto reductase [unclassified Streptomyces]|uniref:aldo/keto reductase n=1 Tax=unclassified Streptomyces TaxID=2593676 RepID=UPI000882935F|nr:MULTISPECIES: aldo/keto reductase [unclassified Streptomyces]PBC83014.1 aryl-alcohol dehydrogenase-like predicted oxidoreductase [Streptomyces sp. 2321.6]SDR45629.1 Predicted oxidoreductase [Streptomyces sp. KS_16]SEC80729.1 Predicted oxidoreductase [Streptomyces sp. 2133.1]SEE87856.1 Predicted oxidoreductase [Streptomyces sp. 2112.3]SNC69092.1 Predicted oxidoreductase [Streptomyces sp. 2114.4]